MSAATKWLLSGAAGVVVAMSAWTMRRDHVVVVENRSGLRLDKVTVTGGGERREIDGVAPNRQVAIKLRAVGDGTFTVSAEANGAHLKSGSCGYHGVTGSSYVNIAIDKDGVAETSCKWGPIR
jgi:hypothetical protein